MQVRYETWYGRELHPPLRFAEAVRRACEQEKVHTVCDIGGGANPLLSLATADQVGIERYVVLDVSEEELAKTPKGYETVAADITHGGLEDLGPFDLVVSHTVAEHVTDPAAFHRSVLELLAPGGQAMHFFPTLYDPVFVVNRVLPNSLSESILLRIQKERTKGGRHEKFPAYYRWCRGPTSRQLERLSRIGFEIDEYVGVFGHGYFHPVPFVNRLAARVAASLSRRPLPSLTAYAWVSLSKPDERPGPRVIEPERSRR